MHVEYYGKEISMEYPVGNSSSCGDLCLNSPDCYFFAYRELFHECALMEELYGVLEKGAFKVISGFKWANNTIVNTTCSDGKKFL